MYSCGDLHAQLARTSPFMLAFKIMIMAINVEPDCRTSSSIVMPSCADSEGGQGVRTPPPGKLQKNIAFLSNTGPDPLYNHKATNPAFNVGPLSARQRNAI